MKELKISVIITVYNIEKYIGECLDSILTQDMDEIEVICVDDASTDKSKEVLRVYQNKDQRIHVISNETNLGQASSRNNGCKIARGKYLYVMDRYLGREWKNYTYVRMHMKMLCPEQNYLRNLLIIMMYMEMYVFSLSIGGFLSKIIYIG